MVRAASLDDIQGFAREGGFAAGRTPTLRRLQVPARLNVDRELVVEWELHGAGRTVLALRGTDEAPRDVAHSGRFTRLMRHPGLVRVELQCWGPASAAPAAPDRVFVRDVVIEAPPVSLHVAQRVLVAAPGATARLHWAADGAARVLLRRSLRDEVCEAPAFGAADIELDAFDETVEVVAVARDGAERCVRRVALRPVPGAETGIDAELQALHPHA